jgi:arylsulfatase
MGTVLGGWSFHLRDGRMRYVHNFVGTERQVIDSPEAVTPGSHLLVFEFDTAGDFRGQGRLRIDGQVVGEGPIRRVPLTRYTLTGGGLTCGWEQGPAVGEDYEAPFRFTGTLDWVTLEANGKLHRDPAAEFEAIMAEQ